MTTLTFNRSIEVPIAASTVWAVVADYGRDPYWRRGVATMAPDPPGIVRVGTTTAEDLRFCGQRYRSAGVVTEVDDGRSFRWHTTSGTTASGVRRVRPLGAGRTQIELHLEITLRGMSALLKGMLGRRFDANLAADLERLRDLLVVEQRAARTVPA